MELNWGNFWQWGRLRPWQILHSKLAEIRTSEDTGDLELWQLLQDHVTSETQRSSGSVGGGGDGEADTVGNLEEVEWMWRYGGVKLSEWLESREEEEDEEEEEEEGGRRRSDGWEEGGWNDGEGEGGGDVEDDGEVRWAAAAPLEMETRYYREVSAALKVAEEEEEEDDDDCPVCLEKLLQRSSSEEAEDEVGFTSPIWRLSCRHHFHLHCISPWLRQRSRCPCCRAPVDLDAAPPILLQTSATAAAPLSDSDPAPDLLSLVADMEAALDSFGLL